MRQGRRDNTGNHYASGTQDAEVTKSMGDRSLSVGRLVAAHVAATYRFVCTGEFLWKSLSLQRNFAAAVSRKNSVWFDFLRHVAAIKFRCGDKDFHQKIQFTRSDLSLRYVAAICCWRIVSHFPSSERQANVKITPREKGGTRRGERKGRPPRLAFLTWGDFHARSHFIRSAIPEGKWGTTRSLLQFVA